MTMTMNITKRLTTGTILSKIDGSDNCLDYTMIGDCLREIVSDWLDETSGPSPRISVTIDSPYTTPISMLTISLLTTTAKS